MIHELPLERANLNAHFLRDLESVLTVDPGDSVRIDVPIVVDCVSPKS